MTTTRIDSIIPSETMRANDAQTQKPEPAWGHSWVSPQVSTWAGSWIIPDGKAQGIQLQSVVKQGCANSEPPRWQDTVHCKMALRALELSGASFHGQERGLLLSLHRRFTRRNGHRTPPSHFCNQNIKGIGANSDLANALDKQQDGQEIREAHHCFQDTGFVRQSVRKGTLLRLERELWAEFLFDTLNKNRHQVTKKRPELRVSN